MLLICLALVITVLALFLGTSVERAAIDIIGIGIGLALQMLAMRFVHKKRNTDLWNLIFGPMAGLFFAELLTGYHTHWYASGWRTGLPFLTASLFMIGAFFLSVLLHYAEVGPLGSQYKKAEVLVMAASAISACALGYELGLRIWII
jgi:hypothetical protein